MSHLQSSRSRHPTTSRSTSTAPGASHLVETDPRFTNQQAFLGSDYFVQQLNRDPARTLKRFGDGFKEQQMVNDQVLALTGRRYLSGYSDTQLEFRSLMDSGVAFARQYQLTPGLALSAEQMALLSTDIVWLTTQTVALADGTSTQVLIPQVYLRQTQAVDLSASGALMSGRTVSIQTTGELVNTASIRGDSVSLVSDTDIVNQGQIAASSVALRAGNDVRNIGGSIGSIGSIGSLGTADAASLASTVRLSAGRDIVLQTTTLASRSANGSSTRTTIDRIATLQGGTVTLDAARDIVAQGASVAATGDLSASAGRDLTVSAVQGSYQISTATGGNVQGRTGHIDERLTTNQVATLSAGRNATLVAQGDVSLVGANLSAVLDVQLQGANVSVDAVKDRQAIDVQNVGAGRYNAAARVDETLAGGRISAGNNLSLVATGRIDANGKTVVGTGNLILTGAALTAGATAGAPGRAVLIANNDVTIKNTITEHTLSSASFDTRSDWLSSSTDSASSASRTLQVESATISAGSLSIQAGAQATRTGNVLIQGSQLVATRDLTLSAGQDLRLTAAQQTSATQSSASSQKSGLFAGADGLSFTIGRQQQSEDGSASTVTNVGSQVASLSGNVTLAAGENYRQSASQVLALAQGANPNAGDINITAKRVDLDTATNTQTSASQQSSRQSGVTVAFSNPLIAALQTGQQMAAAASNTQGDVRLQALAAATAVFAGVQAAKSLADGSATSIGVNISAGVSMSASDSRQTSSNAAGSAVKAARDLTIRATGGDLSAVGADLEAARNATLTASGALNLQAATSTTDQHATNTSAGGSVGIGFTVGSKTGFTINANANAGLGNQGGTDAAYANTSVKAGATATLVSGGDTTLKGAVVAANQVVANAGGNLNVQSLQDTSVFDAKQVSAGLGVSLCLPPFCYGPSSASGSFAMAKATGDFASVIEQSGVKAGDGGFQIAVASRASSSIASRTFFGFGAWRWNASSRWPSIAAQPSSCDGDLWRLWATTRAA